MGLDGHGREITAPLDVAWLGAEVGLPEPSGLAEFARHINGEVLAFPGLVNSHDHLEFNCYPPTGSPPYRDFVEWSRDVRAERTLVRTVERIPFETRRQFGLLKNLLWGVPAVADHGGKGGGNTIEIISNVQTIHSPELERWPRLRLAAGSGTVVLHLGEGTTAGSAASARALLRWNLRRRRIGGVHAVSLSDDDFDRLDALIWCPASNHFLFGRTADVAAAARRTRILFGTDSTLSAPGTLWDHLRQVRGVLSDKVLLAALTTAPAAFWGLTPRQDDFVLAKRRKKDNWDAFFAMTPADILLVVHRGQIVLVDAACMIGTAASDDFFTVAWGGARKFVRLPVPAMLRQVRQTAPAYDLSALVGRLAGADARRAA